MTIENKVLERVKKMIALGNDAAAQLSTDTGRSPVLRGEKNDHSYRFDRQ